LKLQIEQIAKVKLKTWNAIELKTVNSMNTIVTIVVHMCQSGESKKIKAEGKLDFGKNHHYKVDLKVWYAI